MPISAKRQRSRASASSSSRPSSTSRSRPRKADPPDGGASGPRRSCLQSQFRIMVEALFSLPCSLSAAAIAQSPQELVQDAQQNSGPAISRARFPNTGSFSRCIRRRRLSIQTSARLLPGWADLKKPSPNTRSPLRSHPPRTKLDSISPSVTTRWADTKMRPRSLRRCDSESPDNHQAALLLGDCYMRLGREKRRYPHPGAGERQVPGRPRRRLSAGNGADSREACRGRPGPGRSHPAQWRLG